MKMQNEIESPVNGKVVTVSTKAGAIVMKDDVLIEIKVE
jgi:biotin carboxyl carrier protein